MHRKIIELVIQLGVLFVLVLWCFTIIKPFVLIIMWGIIVAIALFPVQQKLSELLGPHHKTFAGIFVAILITVLVLPTVLLTESLLVGAQALADSGGDLNLPPPPDSVREWPLIGERIHDLWMRATTNLPSVLKEFGPQIKLAGAWILETVTGTGIGILQFIIAFIISGVLLVNAEKGERAANAFAHKLAPHKGAAFAKLASSTIRNVALGIVGISILQASFLSLGFLAIDLPAAGLAALVALILCIIQIGPGIVSFTAIAYAFTTLDTVPAVVFTIWTLVITMSDGVLKPFVFGRGGAAPTLVIFVGAIGGMLAYGIIGLFVGAVVLAMGYNLYEAWLEEEATNLAQKTQETADPETLEAEYKV